MGVGGISGGLGMRDWRSGDEGGISGGVGMRDWRSGDEEDRE